MRIIISEYDQISQYLRENHSKLSTYTDYQPIIIDICYCLNYKEIQKLINEFGYLVNDSENLFHFLAEKRKVIFDRVEANLTQTINASKISLSTPDFIAYLINRLIKFKAEIQEYPFFFRELTIMVYLLKKEIKVATELLDDEIVISDISTYGISYFFLNKRHIAEIEFENYLNKYRNYLETIDYEKIINLFFDRLGLDNIPCSKDKDFDELPNSAFSKIYISKFEILQLFSNKNFNNVDDFRVKNEKLLIVNNSTKNITKYNFEYKNIDLFKKALYLFFVEHYDKRHKLSEDIEVFFTCLTEANPKSFHTNEGSVKNARIRLVNVVKNNSIEFLDLIFKLDFIFKTSQLKLAYLISEFFNLQGMKIDTCHDHFRNKRNKALYTIKNKELKNFVESANWTVLTLTINLPKKLKFLLSES